MEGVEHNHIGCSMKQNLLLAAKGLPLVVKQKQIGACLEYVVLENPPISHVVCGTHGSPLQING